MSKRSEQSGLSLSSEDIQTEKMKNSPGSSLEGQAFSPERGNGSGVQCLDWANAEERKSV